MATSWTYEGYWNAVLGANRDAADVVREFELVSDGLEEWLDSAETAARVADWMTELPEEWPGFHARTLRALESACATPGATS
jgi:hypothetical protein